MKIHSHYFSYHSTKVKSNIISNFVTRALRLCDPEHLDSELQHIRNVFHKLCYPKYFIDKAFTFAKRKHFIPSQQTDRTTQSNYLTMPYHHKLIDAKRLYDNTQPNTKLAFSYKNSIASKLTNNNSKPSSVAGVYSVPCKDCSKCYYGETGRGLDVRLSEHKRACRMGHENNMISKHTWVNNHVIDWNNSKVLYKSSSAGKRRVVEGAFICLFDTFDNNKPFTNEDFITNFLICKSLRLDFNYFRTIPDARNASSSPVQVLGDDTLTPTTGAGANEDVTLDTSNSSQREPPIRRSVRLLARSRIIDDGIT